MKHHKQMIRGSIPSLEKLRAAAGKRPPLTAAEEAIADIAPTEWPKIAEGVEVPARRPTWAARLRRALGRAIMRVAVLFRRRMT